MRTIQHLLALPLEQRTENARRGGKTSGPKHSKEHMAEIGRHGGRSRKPGKQNNRFTKEQAKAAQLKSAKARKGKKYRPRGVSKSTNLWGVRR